MFEFSVAFKYLIPKRKQLSVSLISLMSVAVISLVVWLVLIFLSVTEGIERNWLCKLTTLNAPLRITPTAHYYNSYYYMADAVSSASNYRSKNIAQKLKAQTADPFLPEEDESLPSHFPSPDLNPDGTLLNPVSKLFQILTNLQNERKDLVFQDFEMSGALLRLQLLRPAEFPRFEDTQSYMTQVSYLATFPRECPALNTLILPPTEKDVNHLLYLAGHATEHSRQDSPALTLKADPNATSQRIERLFKEFQIEQLKPKNPLWQIPPALLPEQKSFLAFAHFRGNQISRIDIPAQLGIPAPAGAQVVKLRREQGYFSIETQDNPPITLPLSIPLLAYGDVRLEVDAPPSLNPQGSLMYQVKFALQNIPLGGLVAGNGLETAKARLLRSQIEPPSVNAENETGIYLAKNYQENGVLLGDRGYLSYSSATAGSVQEHRLPVFVSGFYDPGILSVGNKCILVPPHVTETINASGSSFNLDPSQANGILVWFNNLDLADSIKNEVIASLEKEGIGAYWKVTSYREYDFAKDLLEQFESDKYLFTLVGIIILIIACCNIISLLVLLVNDKKREIGILQAMGCSRKSIALIFCSCGAAMGIVSSAAGVIAAIATLKNIDWLVRLLSSIQGHETFNTAFFGKTLPSAISHDALIFVLIATPLLSMIAGIVPALKACRLRPSEILRSE